MKTVIEPGICPAEQLTPQVESIVRHLETVFQLTILCCLGIGGLILVRLFCL